MLLFTFTSPDIFWQGKAPNPQEGGKIINEFYNNFNNLTHEQYDELLIEGKIIVNGRTYTFSMHDDESEIVWSE